MTDKDANDVDKDVKNDNLLSINTSPKGNSMTSPKSTIKSRRNTKHTTKAMTPLSQAASKNSSRLENQSEQDYEYRK